MLVTTSFLLLLVRHLLLEAMHLFLVAFLFLFAGLDLEMEWHECFFFPKQRLKKMCRCVSSNAPCVRCGPGASRPELMQMLEKVANSY